MNHISIEGMDGVGKSTTCLLLAQKTGYKFVEKPLHYLFDEAENEFTNYLRVRDIVNSNPDRVFTSLFYGLGSLYMYNKFQNENIITDRHLASNYAWSGSTNNSEVYDLLVNKLGKPTLTVILYSPNEVIKARLTKRDKNDSDLEKIDNSEMIYARMIEFCAKYEFPYLFLDTSTLSPEEIVAKIIERVAI